MSYLRNLKTGLVLALRDTFDGNYPDATLQNLHVSIEYPIEKQHYPSIWVDFEDSALINAGIAHYEQDEDFNRLLRWRFEGSVSYTIAALSSLERDRIYDEMVKVLAFSRSNDELNAFREFVEDNEFIAMNFNFDEIEVHGTAAVPGTPWETDEIIYEKTLSMQLIGEFVTDVDTSNLVPLRKILIDGRTMPSTEDDPENPMHWEIPRADTDPDGWI